MTKNRKKLLALWLSVAVVISILPVSVFSMQEAKAAGYGISNPRTDNSGVSTWDCIYFGNYWQDDTTGDNEVNETDEKQPIKWRVLSVNDDDAFLLSDKNLDYRSYETEYDDVAWETSGMRSWLNKDFYNAAFSDAEKSAIKETSVESGNGSKVYDKVYLLSVEEVMNPYYGFNEKTYNSETREAKNTLYAHQCGAVNDAGDLETWFLRPTGSDSMHVPVVHYAGKVDDNADYGFSSEAVRPVLHLKLSSNVWEKAGTESAMGGPDVTNPAGEQTAKPVFTEKPKDNPTVSEKPKTTSVTAPSKVQKLTAKNKKKKSAVLSWKKVSGVKGYQLQYAANKKFKNKTSKLTAKTKFTVKNLKKKKTYWFRVRAYKLDGKKKVYGKWSSVTKIRIKK